MSIELWTAFVLASTALLAIPGPTVTVVVGHAIAGGRPAAWATLPGVVLGDFVAMTASLLGAGAILATSATLFMVLKLGGAAYLIWLGICMWRAPVTEGRIEGEAPVSRSAVFWNCFVVTALNPKDILFFVAFVPQFIDPNAPAITQFVILEATFLTMVAVNIGFWSLTAGHLGSRLTTPGRLRVMNRVGGSVLIGAGAFTARS